MVKRVHDVKGVEVKDEKVDSTAALKDVKEVSNIVSIDNEVEDSSHEQVKKQTKQAKVKLSCSLCSSKSKDALKYYNVALLKKFVSVRGKMIPRSKSGVCAKHQRMLRREVRRARILAFLPFVDVGV